MTQKEVVLNFLKENGSVSPKEDFFKFNQINPEISKSNFLWYRNDLIKKLYIQKSDNNILKKELRFKNRKKVTIEEVEKLALDLLSVTWDLDFIKNVNLSKRNWTFRFGTYKKAFGKCKRNKKEISLSKFIISNNLDKPDLIENTIRHELAHAIDTEYRNTSDHSRIWQTIAKSILCDGKQFTNGYDISNSKYILYCPKCDYKTYNNRKFIEHRKNFRCCPKCYKQSNEYIKLIQKENK